MADDRELLELPLLPLRDVVVFPHQVVPLFVGREKSLLALEETMSKNGRNDIFFAAQRTANVDEPTSTDLHAVGTIGSILQLLRLPDGTVKVLVEGVRRGRVTRYLRTDGCFEVEVSPIEIPVEEGIELGPLLREVRNAFETYVKLNPRIAPAILNAVETIEDPGQFADIIVGHLPLKLEEKQGLLELVSPTARLTRLYEILKEEIEVIKVERRIKTKVKRRAERNEKQQIVNEQIQHFQRQIENDAGQTNDGGERDEFKDELNELEKRVREKKLSKEAESRVLKEIRKLRMMAPMSAEATVIRNYVDWVLGLPWGEKSVATIDVVLAKKTLDEEHFGLEKIKERIIEYLAVRKLAPRSRGPILCLVGPPGVGKTSLGRSIARATGRTFVRLALGGVRDEAEIRGHRRTYVGALPGKIIQSMKKAGSDNPLFLLDEVDKMTADFRGDPSAALLEVLDPEQNTGFVDHYLDLDYDLSDVMFITTANYLHEIPAPLQDRLEIISIPSYTEHEKVAIAMNHLIPRQKRDNGIEHVSLKFPEESVRSLITGYTKEAGVRALDREIGAVCRKIAREVAEHPDKLVWKVSGSLLSRFLGPSKYRQGKAETQDEIGMVNGLAVTSHGGDLLAAEVSIVAGRGKLVLTGKLGDVMQESAQAALSYLRSRALSLGLDPEFHQRADIHVHLPEGGIPKDGPSAGITICTALASALLRIPVRRDVAMTGEITLRGRVLPIGGLKEKVMAAHRGGIKRVIVPQDNVRDLRDVPKRVLSQIKIIPVSHMDAVLREALALTDPAEFLKDPSVAMDWRIPGERRHNERRGEPVAVASAVPPAGMPAEAPMLPELPDVLDRVGAPAKSE